MSLSLDSPFICPVLIGREPQITLLDRLLERAGSGRGQAALIAGEAGVGKSRLAAEVKVRAINQGFAVLQGRCFAPDRALPYAPLIDLLRTLVATHAPGAIVQALGPMAPQLVGLLPEILPTISDLVRLPALDPEQERRRITQAFVQFFSYRSAMQPLLLIVEDLHWSDDASLDTLLALARRVALLPLLLLLTYRGDESPPELLHTLALLERERLASELHLSRLDYAQVDAMLRAIFDQRRPIRSEFLASLYVLTEGNPFFIEEVLKSLVTLGDIFYADGQWDRKPLHELHIPRTVQVAVQQRVEGLSADTRRLLMLATVAGRRFDFGLLQRLTGHDESTLLDLIKNLIAAQLVVEESAEVFAFRHALTREALYAEMLVRERKALHGLIAVALETNAQERSSAGRDVWAADLAYHFYAAEVWHKALEYAQEAAQQAQRLHAPRAVVEHLSRAIPAMRQLNLPPSPALYLARGQMYDIQGEFESARNDFQAALEAARTVGARQAEWQALLDLGFLWASRDHATMGAYLEQALALARTLGDPITLGHSLNRVGNWHLVAEQPREALRYHQDALALFQEAGDAHGLAATYDLLGVTNVMAGDIAAGMMHYEQAVALFRTLGDPQGLSSCLATLALRGASYTFSGTAWPIVDAVACIGDGEEALRVARHIGWRAGEANASTYLAMAYGPRGEYALALERAQAALEIAQEIGHDVWIVGARIALGAIALDLLAFEVARDHLEQALEMAHELGGFLVRYIASLLTSTCVAQRDLARVEAVLATTFTMDTPMEMQGQRLIWCARAELALASGDPAEALRIADQLIASAAQAERYGAGCAPRLWHLRGTALAALGRDADAEASLLAANQGAAERGLRPMCWRLQASLGRCYQHLGRRKQAEESFAAARALVDQLAITIVDDTMREAFRRGADKLLPRLPNPTPRRAAKGAFDGLTEREREIAALIAQGRSNREIAEALVLSERTVATHVSNALAKLNFTTRAQVAAWASEKGLVKPQ